MRDLHQVFHHEDRGHAPLPVEDETRLVRLSDQLRAILADRERSGGSEVSIAPSTEGPMTPDEHRPAEPRVIDAADPEQLRQTAQELRCTPETVAEAVGKVGPNRTAVELWLAAPKP